MMSTSQSGCGHKLCFGLECDKNVEGFDMCSQLRDGLQGLKCDKKMSRF